MTTIKDIAKATGFSVNTVSNAMRDRSNVKESTKRHIQKIAREMNYIPNAIARSLVSKKTKLIALVIHSMEDPFYTELTNNLEKSIYASDYKLMLFNHGESIERQDDIIDSILEQNIDGILINPALSDEKIMEKMINSNTPFVVLVRNYENYHVNFVGIDFKLSYELIVEHFVKYNRRNILNICGSQETQSSKTREAAYKNVLKMKNIDYDHDLVINNIKSERHLFEQLDELLQTKKTIDSVFCYDYKRTSSLLKYCKLNNISIPDDLALIGFNVDEFCENSYIPVTAIKYDIKGIGEMAWMILKELITKESTKRITQNIYTKPELVIRESCGEKKDKVIKNG